MYAKMVDITFTSFGDYKVFLGMDGPPELIKTVLVTDHGAPRPLGD